MRLKEAQNQWEEDMGVSAYSQDELDQMMYNLYEGDKMGYWNTD